MTIVGTRPEIIRLSAVIKECDRCFDHILVHTGQNYDYNLNEIFFKELKIPPPKHFLECVSQNLGGTLGSIISKSYDIMIEEKPDAVLILGDTNSALSAIAAKRLKIPIFHMEAGNRCFDENVPEEINRKIVDHISEINLPYTEHSRRYLLDEGIDKKNIFTTGSPMPEVIMQHLEEIENSTIVDDLGLNPKQYFVLSLHREENVDNVATFESVIQAINYIAEEYKLPIIFSTHPRTAKWLKQRDITLHRFVKNMEPLGFIDYNKLQKQSLCVLSDSGTLSEESTILNFNGILLRTSTERPEVLDKGRIVIGGTSRENIVRAIDLSMKTNDDDGYIAVPWDYYDLNVAKKVVKIVGSCLAMIK